MFPTKHQLGRALHGASAHDLRVLALQAERDGAVDERFEEEGEEGGRGGAQGGAGVEAGGGDVGDGADGGEEPIDDAEHGGRGALRSGDDGGGGADEGGGVGHGADDGGGATAEVVGRVEQVFDLGDGDAGEDADEQFTLQGVDDGGFAEAGGEVLRLAA